MYICQGRISHPYCLEPEALESIRLPFISSPLFLRSLPLGCPVHQHLKMMLSGVESLIIIIITPPGQGMLKKPSHIQDTPAAARLVMFSPTLPIMKA